jgi:5-hydroxyisourate hydrolase
MQVTLQRVHDDRVETITSFELNAEGRNEGGPLLSASAMAAGKWRLVFEVADYFRARGTALPEFPFIDRVQIDFGISDPGDHYHVPLLVSPYSYSTYRGS